VLRGAKPLFSIPSPFPLIRGRGIQVKDSSRGWGYWKKLENRATIVPNY